MVRLKKNLSEEEVSEVLDKLKDRIKESTMSKKNSNIIKTKLNDLLEIMEVSMAKPRNLKKLSNLKSTSFKPTPHKEDKICKSVDPSEHNLLEGEIVFTTLTQLLEVVRAEHQTGTIFSQYVNPISQLTGYSSGDGNKYVINIVDLRKDPRADSFTFSPMKLLEEGK